MKYVQYIIFALIIFTLSSFEEAGKLKEKIKPAAVSMEQVLDTVATLDLPMIEEDSIVMAEVEEDSFEVVSDETKASYYHDKFSGKKTASGEVFDNSKYTAAHKTLPFGTKIKVTNLRNKRSVVLTVTDRGPFTKGRSVDISKRAFMDLTDNLGRGVLDVKVERMIEDIQ
ncbi:septal ring lytic transglycosylase RlpA family protein [Myroides odoratus]|jgi:rare lipoprotein A|uniref:Probable endolytic peptidoglycan transglycosylase RlpA n=1 Tax=Myroides odoratus TaxID=256 RepID=A0A9Q6ZE85_MYROD|nr:septal ring lytic transglycosylase RlpA family protein [Myroides odoratus]EHQ42412.1 rare lipoprotein A [Myroides odoratus DSM 2801]EKB08082.1 rare lipoprotein A [Myroides odoratus CIP 103059]MDR0223447.1 septal ring lytic transglycosylase RlpA family protein [Myroides odoratus]QQT99784.1 septal ring lytic transglycosylase RlpA family protein [Myroides odoratus]WQD58002.1 septal ring lytic transglycosylase RlpA family protein [Myroides odoratus]